MRTFGHIHGQPMHSSSGTKADDIMLIMNLKGAGYHVAKEKTLVKAGMVGLIKMEHSGMLFSDKIDPYDHYFIRFRGDYALDLADRIIKQRGHHWFADEKVLNVPRMMPSQPIMIRQELPKELGQFELVLASILLMFLKKDEETHKSTFNKLQVTTYMDHHLGEPFNLKIMSDHFNMAKPSLSRWAKGVFGRTLLEEYEAMRMQRAREFLQSSKLNISEIAERVGYLDPLYFSKVFKKHHHLSPKQYRTSLCLDVQKFRQ